MKTFRLVPMAACLVALFATSCDTPPERQWERGFFEPIGGRSWSLPSGLQLRYMIGYDDVVIGSELPLDMLLTNTTARRIDVKMPAGLCFSPSNLDYAYMLLLQEFRFTVPANGDTNIYLPTFSCNEDKDDPDDESNYSIDIQLWEREMNELFDLVEGKSITTDEAVYLSQDALWEITDGEGLTDSTRQLLKALPDKP